MSLKLHVKPDEILSNHIKKSKISLKSPANVNWEVMHITEK